MSRTWLRLFSFASALTLVLAGCLGDSGGGGGGGTPASGAAASGAPASGAAGTGAVAGATTGATGPIKIWYSNNAEEVAWGKAMVDAWNKDHSG